MNGTMQVNGSRSWKGPVLGLVVSCHHIETFHFALRPTVDLAGVAD